MKADRYEIRFSGSGGQGIITAAIVLAEAIGVYGTKYVCQTQSYGPEARGGRSKAEIVVSDRPIDYPKVIKMDLLLAMNQESCDAYFFDFKPNGLLVVDSGLVEQVPTSRAVCLPFTELALAETGQQVAANMVALGATAALSRCVGIEGLEAALLARVPSGTGEMNLRALRAGIAAAKSIDLQGLPRAITSQDEDEL